MRFFTARELSRTKNLHARHVDSIVLDRTWHSQIVHAFAIIGALDLPLEPLRELFHQLSVLVLDGTLYFPDWLVIFQIPEKVSYRKVIRRDGSFFGTNMERMLTVADRERFLQARAHAYRALLSSRGLPIVTLSYQAHPADKIAAVLTPPADMSARNARLFFDDFWETLMVNAGGKHVSAPPQ